MVATVPSMIGQFNMNNIKILLDLGYKVDVAANFFDRSVWPEERVQLFKNQMNELGIECIQLFFSRNPLKIFSLIKSYKETISLLKERNYSFIHTHTPIASAIVRIAAKKTGTKVIYTAHGFHFYSGAPLLNWIIYYPIEKLLSKYTDVMITINREDYNRALKKFKAKKTVYIPGVGVDTEKFVPRKDGRERIRKELGITDDSFLICSVGELNKNKNHSVIIKALGKLNDCKIHYVIAGRGILQHKLKKMIHHLKLEHTVHLLGFREDIPDLYAASDLGVFPAIREGLGLAAIEGMAAALPLLVSNNRGMRDLIKEKNVFSCNYNDVTGFSKFIYMLKNDEKLRYEQSRTNQIVCKEFDCKVVNQKMFEIYSMVKMKGNEYE